MTVATNFFDFFVWVDIILSEHLPLTVDKTSKFHMAELPDLSIESVFDLCENTNEAFNKR